LYKWLNQYPELHEAVKTAADVFNPRVERALAERAVGYFVVVAFAQRGNGARTRSRLIVKGLIERRGLRSPAL
jgi:hypothetical protein